MKMPGGDSRQLGNSVGWGSDNLDLAAADLGYELGNVGASRELHGDIHLSNVGNSVGWGSLRLNEHPRTVMGQSRSHSPTRADPIDMRRKSALNELS